MKLHVLLTGKSLFPVQYPSVFPELAESEYGELSRSRGEERAVAAALEMNCGEEEIVFCFLCV